MPVRTLCRSFCVAIRFWVGTRKNYKKGGREERSLGGLCREAPSRVKCIYRRVEYLLPIKFCLLAYFLFEPLPSRRTRNLINYREQWNLSQNRIASSTVVVVSASPFFLMNNKISFNAAVEEVSVNICEATKHCHRDAENLCWFEGRRKSIWLIRSFVESSLN